MSAATDGDNGHDKDKGKARQKAHGRQGNAGKTQESRDIVPSVHHMNQSGGGSFAYCCAPDLNAVRVHQISEQKGGALVFQGERW